MAKLQKSPYSGFGRFLIRQGDGNGNWKPWHKGPSNRLLKARHLSGRCRGTCGYCLTAAEHYLMAVEREEAAAKAAA